MSSSIFDEYSVVILLLTISSCMLLLLMYAISVCICYYSSCFRERNNVFFLNTTTNTELHRSVATAEI